ncbi:MAG: class I SAM-dependent methyltransferase [Verrucomicrobiota bacterium]|nr:class I SAM-dependent methyltransferase [Verrucomicrobiota bacterium]
MRFSRRPRIYNSLHALGVVDAYSQTHPEERACLCRHIAKVKAAVEIGTFMGLTAAEMARSLPADATLYCVDPYPGGGEPLLQIALRQIARAGAASKVRMVRADSAGAVANLPAQVDFFFVDGDHSYEGLSADWKIVRQLLKPGGIAAFHDTARAPEAMVHSEGSIRFFEEVITHDPEFTQLETVRSLNVIRRNA